MDNKLRKKKEHAKEQREMIFFIIILVLVFIVMIFVDKKMPRKLERKRYEGVVPTYDGSLQRNITNPLGLE